MVTADRDREQILDELERYYQTKLEGVRAKRSGSAKPGGAEEIDASEPVRVHVNPKRKQVVLTWE